MSEKTDLFQGRGNVREFKNLLEKIGGGGGEESILSSQFSGINKNFGGEKTKKRICDNNKWEMRENYMYLF